MKKITRLFGILLVVVLFTGCASFFGTTKIEGQYKYTPLYFFELSSVTFPENSMGKENVVITQKLQVFNPEGEFSFEDDYFIFELVILDEKINFAAINKTNYSASINTKDLVFRHFDGQQSELLVRVKGQGTKRESFDHKRILLMPNLKVQEVVKPESSFNVFGSSRPLFSESTYEKETLIENAIRDMGKSFFLYVPIEVGDNITTYIFEFKVADAIFSLSIRYDGYYPDKFVGFYYFPEDTFSDQE